MDDLGRWIVDHPGEYFMGAVIVASLIAGGIGMTLVYLVTH